LARQMLQVSYSIFKITKNGFFIKMNFAKTHKFKKFPRSSTQILMKFWLVKMLLMSAGLNLEIW